ncbi:short-chain dehydrogenase [Chaetomium strumarium]|uniref:Short-chain dehydrogenase n=1 Tax=Chaetomium strumarium TaxID=1170767 RepID=A0AAJ0GKZ9_9PEZI|nr:short-chain dehydrogenase [Chaetomium strumarium]
MEPSRLPYTLPSDAVWFITGCSSGIGKSLAELVVAKGQRLVATARKLEDLAYLPDNPPNSSILKLRVDVASKQSVDDAVAAALAHFARLDVVVNNAGYSLRGDTENAPEEAARHQLETMFWGTVRLTRHAMRIMREVNPAAPGGQQGGVVVNVSSMGGRAAFPGNAFYHAAKFAVEGFTESVAREVRPEWNIHFCLVEPGGVRTGFTGHRMQRIEVHPAYAAPDTPSRLLDKYIDDPEASKNFADVDDVTKAMYSIVASGKEIPLRVPIGPDAWGVLKIENEKNGKALDEWKDFAISAGKAGQFESLDFMTGRESRN